MTQCHDPRHQTLIEQLIAATRRANTAEQTLRELEDEPGATHLAAIWRSRCEQAEANIRRLTRRQRTTKEQPQ